MFEEARQQLEQQITKETADPVAPEATPGQEASASEEAKQLEAVADLSKFKKILLDGQELTLDDLKKQRMLEADYRRKTAAHAEERRRFEQESTFAVNFPKDLELVMQQPWMAQEFYNVYPPEYHAQVKWLEQMYRRNPALWAQDQGSQVQSDNSQDVKSVVEELINERLKPFEEKERQAQVQTNLAKIDAIETRLSQKYDEAVKAEVYMAAEYLSDKTGRELSDADWEKIYKDSHERNQKARKERNAKEAQQQKVANSKLRDVASGGGVPGEAPVVAKSIKEATKHFFGAHGS
jgi:hypothetical protein